jgi:DNA-directed RNA polymerase specialized sigma24 family protein
MAHSGGSHLPTERTKSDAFTDFVIEVEAKLRQALTGALGSEDGREAAAQALAYGWEHWDRIQEMANPAGYLFRVGLNWGRHNADRHRPSLPLAPLGRMPWVEPGLPQALGMLSSHQRAAVFLVYGHEWSLSEVADWLRVSKGTVQKHLERGMRKLRRRLGVEGVGHDD